MRNILILLLSLAACAHNKPQSMDAHEQGVKTRLIVDSSKRHFESTDPELVFNALVQVIKDENFEVLSADKNSFTLSAKQGLASDPNDLHLDLAHRGRQDLASTPDSSDLWTRTKQNSSYPESIELNVKRHGSNGSLVSTTLKSRVQQKASKQTLREIHQRRMNEILEMIDVRVKFDQAFSLARMNSGL